MQNNLETYAATGLTNAGYDNYVDCKHIIIEVQPAETRESIQLPGHRSYEKTKIIFYKKKVSCVF